MTIDKDDPYRLRYAELLHKDWNTADRGFFTYAAKDAEATIRSWQRLKRRAVSWKTPAPFGMLTETLQTQASLALRQIEINGLQLDLQLAKSTEERFQLELLQTVETLQEVPGAEDLFKRFKKTGEMRFSKGGKPQMDFSVLRGKLQAVAEENGIDVEMTPSGHRPRLAAVAGAEQESNAHAKAAA